MAVFSFVIDAVVCVVVYTKKKKAIQNHSMKPFNLVHVHLFLVQVQAAAAVGCFRVAYNSHGTQPQLAVGWHPIEVSLRHADRDIPAHRDASFDGMRARRGEGESCAF